MRRFYFPLLTAALLSALMVVVPMQVVLHAAITVTERMAGGNGAGLGFTTNVHTYTTVDTMTIASGSVTLCFLQNSDTAADTADEWTSVTAGAVSFTKADGTLFTTTNIGRVGAWYATSAISAAALTVDNGTGGGDTETGFMATCYEITGADTTTPILQTKVGTDTTTTNHTVTMTNARTSGSVLFQYTGAQASLTWTGETASGCSCFTVGTNDVSYASPTVEGVAQWNINGSDTTPNFGTASASTGTVAVEIALAAAGGAAGCKGAIGLLGVGCHP